MLSIRLTVRQVSTCVLAAERCVTSSNVSALDMGATRISIELAGSILINLGRVFAYARLIGLECFIDLAAQDYLGEVY